MDSQYHVIVRDLYGQLVQARARSLYPSIIVLGAEAMRALEGAAVFPCPGNGRWIFGIQCISSKDAPAGFVKLYVEVR